MPYITREDGEHFVIPSYRDVLSSKNKSQLKKDILLLSQSYGEYITLQKKGAVQYEVAFSPDQGYLLGETVWQHFNKPDDLIYCEAIPNSTEAILVIVKDGSVYLDGSFPQENIPEELVVFLTQEVHFEIYVYGDVPISQTPGEGKFTFDAKAIKTFTVLDAPVFPTLPLIPAYKFQLVEPVLKAHGIGVLPIKQIAIILIVGALGYYIYSTMLAPAPVVEEAQKEVVVNPYQDYYDTLTSPAPEVEVEAFADKLEELLLIPGWTVTELTYTRGNINSKILSFGGYASVQGIMNWAKAHNYKVTIATDKLTLDVPITVKNRSQPKQIYDLQEVQAVLIDRVGRVSPGNKMSLSPPKTKNKFKEIEFKIDITDAAPFFVDLVGKQLKGLPIVITQITGKVDEGTKTFTGSIQFKALGN